MERKKPSIKKRIIASTYICGALIAVLILRISYIQFVDGQRLKALALDQQTEEQSISPKRGTIFDRNGAELAVSANVETVIASPDVIKNKGNADQVADTLAPILEMDRNTIYNLVTKESKHQFIKKKIESEVAAKLREYLSGKKIDETPLSPEEKKGHDLTGISLVEDTKRYYPFGDFASHIIGFTGDDNVGLEGIEATYDKYLKGKTGRIVKSGTTKGTSPFEYEKYYNAENGLNISLTIDETIQHFVEKNLDEAFIENKAAKGACAIVMDPKTGEVLAMVNKPSFDLNDPYTLPPEIMSTLGGLNEKEKKEAARVERQKLWRNKSVSDTYEPGSTFKVSTCAMALEEKATSLNDTYFCPGYHIVGGRRISCWKPQGHGSQTFLKGMVTSCNPTLMQVGAKIGKDSFYQYFKSFGYRETLGFDLPGEAVGPFHTYNNFNDTELATASFGQGFQITPLQLVTAMSAFINGGTLYRPHVVKEITDENQSIVEKYDPEIIRQIISKETSDQLRYVMETTVMESKSTSAVKGYRVGGKSGTSEKLPRGSGKFIASFIAFAPVEDPKFVITVIIDEPSGASYYGGVISAPVVGKIASDILHYYGISPSTVVEEENKKVAVPSVVGKTPDEAKGILEDCKLTLRIIGTGSTIESQSPEEGVEVAEYSTVSLYTK